MIKNFFKYLDVTKLEKVILVDIIFFLFAAVLFFNFFLPNIEFKNFIENGAEFSQLSESFLSGRLDLQKPGDLDCSYGNEKCYWALGPAPAVLLLPFVFLAKLFGQFFFQGYLNFFLVVFIFLICRLLAKRFGFDKHDSLWLAFAFCFASVFLSAAFYSSSWHFSHVVNTFFLLLSFLEFFGKKRYWLIGVFLGAVFATRLNSGLAIIFFILEILFDREAVWKEKIKSLSLIFLPIFVCFLALGAYNYARFDNFFDTGYARAQNGQPFQQYLKEKFGLFSWHYLLTNAYYSLLKLPEPILDFGYMLKAPYFRVSPLGLSFFFVSPIFFWIFFAGFKTKTLKFLYLTSFLILLSVLLYFNSGYLQFGPRYFMDFLPLLFIVLLYSFKNSRLTAKSKILITTSAFLNLYLFLGFFILF